MRDFKGMDHWSLAVASQRFRTIKICPKDVAFFGVYERAPRTGAKFVAYADAAGGTGSDSFAFAIAERAKDGMAVLCALRERKPRFVPAQVISELAELCKAYGISEIQSDIPGNCLSIIPETVVLERRR